MNQQFASKADFLTFSSLLLPSFLFPFPSISSLYQPQINFSSLSFFLSPSPYSPSLSLLFSLFHSPAMLFVTPIFKDTLTSSRYICCPVYVIPVEKNASLLSNFTNHLIAESHWFGCYHEFIPGPELLG